MRPLRRPLAVAPAVAVSAAGLAAAGLAVAAPRAQSALECGIAADMAVVAKSLAAEAIDRAKADTIMARIYDVSQSERGKALMKDITDAAYAGSPTNAAAGAGGRAAAGADARAAAGADGRAAAGADGNAAGSGSAAAAAAAAPDVPENSAQKFAENLYATCVKSGGDMDPVLGKRL